MPLAYVLSRCGDNQAVVQMYTVDPSHIETRTFNVRCFNRGIESRTPPIHLVWGTLSSQGDSRTRDDGRRW